MRRAPAPWRSAPSPRCPWHRGRSATSPRSPIRSPSHRSSSASRSSRPSSASPATRSNLPIPEGKLAVSVQLADPARVAGFVAPGSEVAIFLTIEGGRGADSEVTRVLLPKVQVIATGATTLVSTITTAEGETQTEELPKALLTLAVSQSEAQKVVYGSQHGQMYFGLLTADSKIDRSDSRRHRREPLRLTWPPSSTSIPTLPGCCTPRSARTASCCRPWTRCAATSRRSSPRTPSSSAPTSTSARRSTWPARCA